MSAPTIRVMIDGCKFDVVTGASVAAAVAQFTPHFRRSVHGERRGPLCGMGVCFECRLRIDGIDHIRSCLVTAKEGMQVETDA